MGVPHPRGLGREDRTSGAVGCGDPAVLAGAERDSRGLEAVGDLGQARIVRGLPGLDDQLVGEAVGLG